MSCDVVLRVDKNPSNPDAPKTCEVTVFVRKNVVRVVASADDMYAAIDEASDKVTRQLRKYKTRVIDRRQRSQVPPAPSPVQTSLPTSSRLRRRRKTTSSCARSTSSSRPAERGILVQTDLLGHDFYVFKNATTGLVNVIYHRKNGGYGIIKPKVEENPDA